MRSLFDGPAPPPAPPGGPPRRRPGVRFGEVRARRVIAVGGGKGGIGKSLLSSNLGIELARRGQDVVLIDLDLGGANLHTCLGVEHPSRTLSDFVGREVESLEDVVTETGIDGLRLISGSLDAIGVANPLHQQKLRLMRAVQGLDADVVLLDLGAGSHFNVLDFFLVADFGVVTLVPEPTSVENAYRFVKAAFFRRLKAVEALYDLSELLTQVMQGARPMSPAQLLDAVSARDAERGRRLREEMQGFRPFVVVNSVREAADLTLGDGICTAWRRFFGIELQYLGYVRHDDDAWRAARQRRPLLLERLDQPIAQDIAAIADRLLSAPAPREAPTE